MSEYVTTNNAHIQRATVYSKCKIKEKISTKNHKKKKRMEIREYIAIATAISGIICVASYVLAVQKPETEKAAPYQCGFDAFMDARHKFEIRFYLVAILFIIFDLEISLLFP